MFKDYDKYLSKSLKVYIFVLVVVFILKLVGLDYFGLDTENVILIKISNFCLKHNINYLWQVICLYIQIHIFLCICCNKIKMYIYSFIGTILNLAIQLFVIKFKVETLYPILSTFVLILMPIIVNKKLCFKRQIIMILIIFSYQLVSLSIRNITSSENYYNFLTDLILNLDQLLMLIITYKCYFMKGDSLCLQEVGFYLPEKTHLKNLPTKLQKSLHKFSKLEKVEKISIIIYITLSLIWNTLSVVIILLVAKLNNTLIECVFILISFWLSKRTFGKAFHLPSMAQCFVVSNITYYTLNRITTPLGISIFIPILLGVGLSYVTSKLVKKVYKPLYRGMPKQVFDDTILKVVDIGSEKYKICYEFYIEKKSDIALSIKYNYTEAGIRKIKTRVNEKIKKL